MKVVMFGTPTCHNCKRIHPKVEEYCSSHCIEFTYSNLAEAPRETLDMLIAKGVRQAPAFLLYKDNGDVVILSGDDIFIELNSL